MQKGGSFLLSQTGSEPVFIPEQLTPDQKALGETTREFVEKEVVPVSDKIEAQEKALMPKLLKRAGEVGLLMAEVPESCGGLGLGKVASTIIAENSTAEGSFQVAFMCHTGIGTLPINYWGTENQKKKYLPKLASGEMLAAYALTEANAGSDAMAGKAIAKLTPDKKYYILEGEKIFITNGGFADLFTVFAKVDGKMTAFLVEKSFEGVSTGPEEKKMGIHGSSTVPLILQDVKVPVENVLGEVGRGHKIAFNTLNVGRWKLGAGCVGATKHLIKISAKYVMERQQFGHPIGNFELIREKIADCAIKLYLLESLVYRYAGLLDEAHSSAKDSAQKVKQLEEYAVEASIAKVYGSEVLQFVSDESIQMHGGYGFCDDYIVERFYRDCRVNRIFEGTNEINRLLISGTLLKRATSGELDFMTEIGNILGMLKSGFPKRNAGALLGLWQDVVDQIKRLAIYVCAVGVQKYAEKIQERQALLASVSDIIIEAYAIESGLCRALQGKNPLHETFVKVYIAEKLPELKSKARQLLINIADGKEDEFIKYEKALNRIVPAIVFDTRGAKETAASKILA
ncbi:MAG: acyl-CoA dehydrogenase family protein [Deltaproteobacteria bacterium]|nr:acyl-CoA dehydrogenase family protein [Deltaproteobacteria bacterium]